MDFVNEEVVTDPTQRNQCGTASSKTMMVDKEIQIDFPSPPPANWIVRNSTYEIRDAIATGCNSESM